MYLRIVDPEVIRQAESLIGMPEQPILSGVLRRGNGGFNASSDWHLDPESIELADIAIEVWDGCPALIQPNLDDWADTVGRFCPWTSRVVGRIRWRQPSNALQASGSIR